MNIPHSVSLEVAEALKSYILTDSFERWSNGVNEESPRVFVEDQLRLIPIFYDLRLFSAITKICKNIKEQKKLSEDYMHNYLMRCGINYKKIEREEKLNKVFKNFQSILKSICLFVYDTFKWMMNNHKKKEERKKKTKEEKPTLINQSNDPLKNNIKSILNKNIKVDTCFNSLLESYQNQLYTIYQEEQNKIIIKRMNQNKQEIQLEEGDIKYLLKLILIMKIMNMLSIQVS